MTTTPTDVIRDFYGKLAAGDAPGALGLMAPDIQWTTMWHYKVEGRGPGPVAEGLFKPLMAEWTSFSLVPTEFITEARPWCRSAISKASTAPPARPPRRATPTSGR